jgi:hypothetical protein
VPGLFAAGERRSPLLLPDYRGKEALSRRIDVL